MMKRSHLLVLLLTFGFLATTTTAQESETIGQRGDYVSDASFVVGTYTPAGRRHSAKAMASAALVFLDSLSEEQRKSASHDLQSPERREWTNLPAPVNAGGIRLGDLNSKQVKCACDLLACLFSQQGYGKMRDIMLADDQLLKDGKPRRGFGTENFSLVIFGTPSESEPWAFQIDGHHVGANLALHGDAITMSPSFIGTQPHAFKVAGKEFQPFKHETGMAHKLVNSLSDEQVKSAVIGPTRARIKTGPGNDNKVPKAKGVACSTFNEEQKQVLLGLIKQWVNDLPEAQAAKRLKQIEAELSQMKFAWNGNKKAGSDISYTIQSPSLIIEYACQNLGGNPLDHLHSVYRDPTNEYGKQLK